MRKRKRAYEVKRDEDVKGKEIWRKYRDVCVWSIKETKSLCV